MADKEKVLLVLDEGLKELITVAAQADNRSLNNWINVKLAELVAEQQAGD